MLFVNILFKMSPKNMTDEELAFSKIMFVYFRSSFEKIKKFYGKIISNILRSLCRDAFQKHKKPKERNNRQTDCDNAKQVGKLYWRNSNYIIFYFT